MNYLERLDLQSIRTKPLSDFSASEVAALCIQKYPSAPYAHLRALRSNKDISQRLYIQTKALLEGAGHDTSEINGTTLSVENSLRGRSHKVRSTNH